MRHALAALGLLLPLTACSGGEEQQTLTVLAAASLTETFNELAKDFEAEHEGVEVELVFGSSTALAEQAVDGAPGDVLATADERSMRVAEDGDVLAGTAEAFASNTLTLVTPPDNPAGIASLQDLASPEVDFVVCEATVPCGVLTGQLLEELGITAAPASEEVDVKAVLARVTQGEADAGLVYRTDAVAAGDDVTEVEVVEAGAVATNYFLAPIGEDSERSGLAADFVALVLASDQVFQDAGFAGVVRE